jgi:5-methylthioribose kinase
VRFADGREWVIKQALAKLRTKADWFSDPARVHREALGIRWLGKLAPPGTIPEFVFEDFDHHLLAMQAVPQPHENWKTMLLAGQMRFAHVRQFADLIGSIHGRGAQSAGELAKVFDDVTYFQSLRLEPYYAYTADQVPEAAPFLRHLIDATRTRRMTLVHGDFSPKNILVRDDHLILLDHEVIHWGDPAFDIGFSMAHLLSKARCWPMEGKQKENPGMGPQHEPSLRSRYLHAADQYWDSYYANVRSAPWADSLERWCVQHTLCCLLARVAGRSPLEYLSDRQRTDQRAAVIQLLAAPPNSMSALAKSIVYAN